MKTNRGSVKADKAGRIYARVTFTDSDGKRHDIKKRVANITAGWEEVDKMLREVKDHGGKSLTSKIRTFNDLADEYEKNDLVPARFTSNGRKIHGLRSYKNLQSILKVLRKHFGDCYVKSITYRQIEKFKNDRFDEPIIIHSKHSTEGGIRQRSVAAVNRELSLLRRIFRVAVQDGILLKDPFNAGRPLIRLGDENRRDRVLSPEEEVALLDQCTGERAHLLPIVIMAIDTGMRRGEIMSLRWEDVNLTDRLIGINMAPEKGQFTKTGRGRTVPISDRLAECLTQFRASDSSTVFSGGRVFRLTDFKRAWHTALRNAGIKDLHFHDLRATFSTRLEEGGLARGFVSKLLGHANTRMTDRYTRVNTETMKQAGRLLNARKG